MARTRNPATHAVKRDAFVEAGMRLIAAKGYEALSVQDVIVDVGASKGAFYHYFGSKGDLLEAVVDRIVDGISEQQAGLLAAPGLNGRERLQAVFDQAGRFKADRRELMVALLRPWFSDANVLVRDHVNRATVARLRPLMARLLAEGRDDGSIQVSDPEATAAIVLAMLVASGETTSRLFLDRLDGRITFEEVDRGIRAYDEAIQRLLGLPAGSFRLISDDLLQVWFG